MVSAHVALNIFDAIVLGILVLSGLLSLFRGFIREVLSLIAWIGAAMITLYNVQKVADALKPYVKNSEPAALIVGTLITYFGSLVIISIFNSILLRYIKPGKDVGAVDNILGLVFGLFKGAMIVVLGFFILTLIYSEANYPDWVKNAWSRPYVEQGTKAFVSVMPDYLKNLTSLVKKEGQDKMIDGKTADGAPKTEAAPGEGYDNNTVEKLQQLLGSHDAHDTAPASPNGATP